MTPPAPSAALPLHDVAAVRRIEARAIEGLGGDGFEPMRRAGDAAWRCVLAHWPRVRRIVVACGPGNNGGDGLLLAARALESGVAATVVGPDAQAPRSDIARRAQAAFLAAGGELVAFDGTLPASDLVVDALFGIGFDRAPDAATAALIAAINAGHAPVLSLDVPSGIDAARGSAPGAAVRADRTLQFIADHAGLRTGDAPDHVGVLERATLDLPPALLGHEVPVARLWTAAQLTGALPRRRRGAHKGDGGHVLLAGGDHGSGGAIALAAEAALRCGCGLASVATRAGHLGALLARMPEAMVHAVADRVDVQTAGARATVVAVGPGLGQAPWGVAVLEAAFALHRPLVLDADALNLLARSPRPLPAGTVLTPHPGEAGRLLGVSTAEVQRDRYRAVRALAERFAATVVLKGAGSLVASPDVDGIEVIGAGNPGMAVGGMGDVLTGVVASLRAQHLDPHAAARVGALLHACAGDAAASDGGERGLLPSDLMSRLRALVNA